MGVYKVAFRYKEDRDEALKGIQTILENPKSATTIASLKSKARTFKIAEFPDDDEDDNLIGWDHGDLDFVTTYDGNFMGSDRFEIIFPDPHDLKVRKTIDIIYRNGRKEKLCDVIDYTFTTKALVVRRDMNLHTIMRDAIDEVIEYMA